MKNSREYWQERFKELEESAHAFARDIFKDISDYYELAMSGLERDLTAWYKRYALENGMRFAEAKKLLNSKELKAFRLDLKTYLEKVQEEGLSAEWKKQLDNYYLRMRISRLEAIQLMIQQHLEELFGNQLDSIDKSLRQIYTDGYYHTAFNIQQGAEIGSSFVGVDTNKLDAVLAKPWASDGKNFSDRIWEHKQNLVGLLNREMTQAVIRGDDYSRVINTVAKKMNVSRANAGRLVMTEAAFIGTKAQQDCFKELGVEQYEFVATLDKRTSELCREMDGKVFKLSDMKIGTNAPPLHPHCRSCTAPYFDDDEDLERIARGEDGKTYTVPADMTYEDWKSVYVDKKMSLEEWRKTVSVPFSDDEQYYRKVVRGESSEEVFTNKTYRVNKLEGTQFEMYASVNATIKPRELHEIQKTLGEALKLINPPKDYAVPKICILKFDEAGAVARFSAVENRLGIAQGEFLRSDHNKDFAASDDYRATAVHELLHWLDAREYIKKHGSIKNQEDYIQYRQFLVNRHKKMLEEKGINGYNVGSISKYAKDCWYKGKFDEVYTEYRVLQFLRKGDKDESSVFR